MLLAPVRAWALPPQPAPAPIDSVVAMPYNTMVADLPASETILKQALAEAYRTGRADALGQLHRLLSMVNSLAGSPDSSTYHGLRAVEHFKAQENRLMIGLMLCDLGHGIKRRDLDRAFAYYREGIPILEDLEARPELTRAYNNFSILYEMRGDIDSALYFGRKGLVLVEELSDSTGIPYALNRVALYLLHKQHFEQARDMIMRADTIRHLTNDVHGMAEQRLYFGDLYQAWGKLPEAIAWFTSSIHTARAVKVPYQEQYAQERLAELYELQGDASAALEATRRAFAIKDSVFNERNSKTIIDMEKRYEVAEKDRAIAQLGAEAARRQLYIWLSLGALVLVSVLGLLLYQTKQRRLRAERDAAIIAEREAGLKAVFDATENERGRLARELHDGIGQQLGGLKHRLEHLRGQEGSAPLGEAIGIVDDTAAEVRGLAHQLMPKSLSRLGLVPAMQDLVSRTFDGTGISAVFDHAGVGEDVAPEIATGVYRIAQELISNVLRHAQAGAIDIQLLRNKGYLLLLVQDDGVGLGTVSTGGGIGLRSMSDRARALGGTFAIERAGDRGTLATVRIPLPKQ